ncbi:UNVERIFIED_CONTAM: FISUMP domain-containing protein [Ralstonia mannitolilytica]
MRKMYLLPTILLGVLSYGQVGINNLVPKSTLDVKSKTTDGSTSEGLLIPRVTGNQLKAAETAAVYADDQHATLVFVTAAPDPDSRTGQVEGMDAPGFYYFDAGSNRWVKMVSSGTNTAAVTQLLCSQSTSTGVLEATSPASGVSVKVPYNGGNGGFYSGLSVNSTGTVSGLTAVLPSGTLITGSGELIFSITGTPSVAGTATFNIDLGGESCGFSLPVLANTSFPDAVDVIIDGVTRQMMTRNLGADPTQDPDVPNQAINGVYFQWGKKNAVANASTGTGTISGWSTAAAANKSWNSGSELAPTKVPGNDPCPSGFRVPTNNEWVKFVAASSTSTTGTWATTSSNGATNFSAARRFVNNGSTLTFPTAGIRDGSTGALYGRAYVGNYWSSTESGTYAYNLYFLNGTVTPSNVSIRAYGYSVRCISE